MPGIEKKIVNTWKNLALFKIKQVENREKNTWKKLKNHLNFTGITIPGKYI